ncbi:MAG: response regulator, partial [Deltaproteobacteria bacterium]|nr:response regulator [Deltaproteobacteria bacterium]
MLVIVFITIMIEFLKGPLLINTGNFVFVSMLLFILSQSFVLSKHYAKALGTAESLSEELEQKNIALSRLDTLKDEFLANTSHELRTPLNGIIGIAESLMEGLGGPLSNTTKSNLSVIISSGRRLANLVNDVLDFSKLKNRDITLHLKPVDIHALAAAVLTVSRRLAAGKRIELINAVPDTIPPVSCDEDRMQQILYNLIGNAIKFTDQGEIRISALKKDSFVEIAVADTGIGIPEEKIDDIFQSFEQADTSDTRVFGGTGLGLSITRQLVELHGGHITVTSVKGEGTTFCFTIPVSLDEPVPDPIPQVSGTVNMPVLPPLPEFDPEVSEDIPPDPSLLSGREVRLLAVDDDPVNLRVITNFLSSREVIVSTCTNGLEALERIQKGERPDLILLDIMMPRMNGYEVCRKLRTDFSLSELPVIMLTAKNLVTDLALGFQSGANDYLVKPFTKAELTARVRTHLKLKEIYHVLRENLSLRTELEQRKQTMQDLRIMHHRLTGILNRVEEAVLAVNESNEICYCNRFCAHLMGHEADDIIGLPVSDFLPGNAMDRVSSLMRGMEQDNGPSALFESLHGVAFRHPDKGDLLAEIQVVTLDLEEELLYLLILRESSTTGKGTTPEPVPALKVVEELNRNRHRLQTLEESLKSALDTVPREDPRLLNR